MPNSRSLFSLALISSLAAAACNRSRSDTPAGDERVGAPDRHTLSAGATRQVGQTTRKWRGLEDGVLRVWPLGDSITEGPAGGYRNDLYDLLEDANINVDYVGTIVDQSTRVKDKDMDGHPGFTISNAQENIDGYLKKIQKPDVVLMMLGTNDFAWWTNVTVKEHHGYLIKLVDDLLQRLPNSVLIVATIPPQSPKLIEDVKLDRKAMTEEYNNIVRQWLPTHPEYNKRLFLADVAKDVKESDLSDGIHPTAEAHKRIARTWFKSMQQALGQP